MICQLVDDVNYFLMHKTVTSLMLNRYDVSGNNYNLQTKNQTN